MPTHSSGVRTPSLVITLSLTSLLLIPGGLVVKNLPTNAGDAAAAAKSLQSCPTLCDPIDGSPSGSTIPAILRQEHRSGLPFPSPMHGSEK